MRQSIKRKIKQKGSQLKEKTVYILNHLHIENFRILIPAATVLIILAVICIFVSCQSNPHLPKKNTCTYVRLYVWNMDTDNEKKAGVLYENKTDRFWIQGRDGKMALAKEYTGSNREPMEFSFTEERTDETIFAHSDIGKTEIFHGTLEETERGYAFLREKGYRNILTITDAGSTDIYLKKDNSYYRMLVIPQAGSDDCIVTYAKIPKATWQKINTREVE